MLTGIDAGRRAEEEAGDQKRRERAMASCFPRLVVSSSDPLALRALPLAAEGRHSASGSSSRATR
jgi:hypothetical protein